MWINVGAIDAKTGALYRTKKSLIEALKVAPENVLFEKTSILDTSSLPKRFGTAELQPGMKLTVCGPNPYEDRRWWSTVEVKNGVVRAS